MFQGRSGAALAPTNDEETAVIPLPPVVDTPAVVLAGLLTGGGRPVVLDAGAVREIEPPAVPLLEALMRSVQAAGAPARIAGLSPVLRRRFAGHPLARWISEAAFPGDEQIFVCPDRDELGFSPSLR